MSRIEDKIKEIIQYLKELEEITPDSVEEYKNSNLIRAGCERYFEKIIESVTDLAFLIITTRKFRIPEDDIDAFRILFDNKIINEELYKRLKEAKGMRNIIAHQYGKIDDKIVFDSIDNDLAKDVKEFLKRIK